MRKLTLLTSVLLASSFQTVNVSAQCMNTINCQTLGYTKTSCTKGGVKCPTGNYWYCPKDTTTPQCSSSYKYTCTGAYQSPSGTACNGKYQKCNCSNNYVWNASQGLCLAGSGSGSGGSSSGSGSSNIKCCPSYYVEEETGCSSKPSTKCYGVTCYRLKTDVAVTQAYCTGIYCDSKYIYGTSCTLKKRNGPSDPWVDAGTASNVQLDYATTGLSAPQSCKNPPAGMGRYIEYKKFCPE